MKKIASILLAAVMVATLAGCAVPEEITGGRSASSSGGEQTASDDTKTSSDSAQTDSEDTKPNDDDSTQSKEPEVGYPDEYGEADGTLGDTMHTVFFDYTVNSAYLCDNYQDAYEPLDGNVLLVADVTVNNPFKTSVTMYDTDFQVQWSSDADDAFDFPITFYMEEGETIGDDMLPNEYTLRRFESRDGILVFEVPEGENYFSISYLEYFEDGTEGDVFFVFFNADYK